MDRTHAKIQIGNATYIIEREFVGTMSREELLINKMIEHHTKEIGKALGKEDR